MICIKGKETDFDKVLMPSECLKKFRGNGATPPIEGHDFYWAIEYKTPKQRIAHLIRAMDRESYRKPGIRTIIPAYRKGRNGI